MGCGCGKLQTGFPKTKNMTPKVLEINNPAEVIVFHKVIIPASMGDETDVIPENGLYKNVLLTYEVNGHAYLYSSDGIPTLLNSGLTSFDDLSNRPLYADQEMTSQTNIPDVSAVISNLNTEIQNRIDGDTTLESSITSLSGQLASEAETRAGADSALHDALDSEAGTRAAAISALEDELENKPDASSLATVATSGSYEDLSNTPTNVSDFTNDANYQNATQVATSISSATTPITTALNKNVLADLTINSAYSSSVIAFDKAKQNILSGSTSTSLLSMPIATSDTAGIINPSIYNTIQNNATNIQAILNGSVSIASLPASPTQAQLTTAWQGATGLTTVINGAKINDSSNQKVWTYYTNTNTWYAATNTTQVVVNQWTNSAAGIIKGSTGDGQIYAENDGTGSVNGWDTLNDTVSTINSNYAKITMTSTDPGEGQPLAANNFIFVYEA